MKLLLLADKESPYFWDYYQPGRLREYDLMLSCGDLKAEYLSFLATLGRAPLYYVRGNHDGNYDRRPPEGCDCIEDKLIIFNGLRIAGLGGSRLYSGGKDQYSEREMKNRIWKLGWQIRRAGGVTSCWRTPRCGASATGTITRTWASRRFAAARPV